MGGKGSGNHGHKGKEGGGSTPKGNRGKLINIKREVRENFEKHISDYPALKHLK